jgi:hypothetical protein
MKGRMKTGCTESMKTVSSLSTALMNSYVEEDLAGHPYYCLFSAALITDGAAPKNPLNYLKEKLPVYHMG